MNADDYAYSRECELFHQMAKKFKLQGVSEVYYVVQAALAFRKKRVDVGLIAGRIMPHGRGSTDYFCSNIGPHSFALLSFLFEITLDKKVGVDDHEYLFRRKYDDATIVVFLKTVSDPDSDRFQKKRDEYLKKVTKLRNRLIEKEDAEHQPEY